MLLFVTAQDPIALLHRLQRVLWKQVTRSQMGPVSRKQAGWAPFAAFAQWLLPQEKLAGMAALAWNSGISCQQFPENKVMSFAGLNESSIPQLVYMSISLKPIGSTLNKVRSRLQSIWVISMCPKVGSRCADISSLLFKLALPFKENLQRDSFPFEGQQVSVTPTFLPSPFTH